MQDENDILKFVSETHRKQFDERRVHEWRVFMATVTFYVLAAAAKLGGRAQLPDTTWFRVMVWVVLLAIAAGSVWYLRHVEAAHNTNKRFAEAAESALIDRANIEQLRALLALPEVKAQAAGLTRRAWSLWWQAGAIGVFALVAAWLLTT